MVREVSLLPRKYRDAIHLCHLDGLTHDRAAEALNLPVGTVRSRLARGRDLLRTRFVRRGLAPAALLGTLESATARAAVPARLLKSTSAMALPFAAGEIAAISATSVALAASTLRSSLMMKWTLILAACVATASTGTAVMMAAQDAPEQKPEVAATEKPRAKTLRERYDEIEKEQEARDTAYFKAYRDVEAKTKNLKTEEEKREIRKQGFKDTPYVRHYRDYMKRFEALADEAPDDLVAADALYAAFQSIAHVGHLVNGNDEAFQRVREDLAMSHAVLDRMVKYADDPRMRNYLQQIGLSPSTHSEHLCREVLARNKDHEALGHATQALAIGMSYLAASSKTGSWTPENREYHEKSTPAEELERLNGRDPASMNAEAEALHEKVVSDFSDVRLFPAYPGKDDPRTIAKQSIDWLATRRELAIGKEAPLFTGKDLDGKEFSLKDYRGKVVALVFWASWCGPCMMEIPHEKELAAKMGGKPFALLGVNSDYTPEKARQAIAEEKITWPNWYDGDPSKSRPIGDAYHVLGIPAIFVLDAEGVIRFKDVRDKKLLEAVETLLKEQEAKRAKP